MKESDFVRADRGSGASDASMAVNAFNFAAFSIWSTMAFSWFTSATAFSTPMAKTLSQLQKQIADLQSQANAVRAKEVADIIDKIKAAIAHYGLTAYDLGLIAGRGKKLAHTVGGKKGSGAQYRDGSGNEWSGRGPRPKWLREALAAGKSLSDFNAKSSSTDLSPTDGRLKRSKGKPVKRAKYRDSHGNSWTGHGRQPQWFKDALASGVTAEQLAT